MLHQLPSVVRKFTTLVLCVSATAGVHAELTGGSDLPGIALIVDDMGYRHRDGQRMLALPYPLAYAFLPHAPSSRELAERAHVLGRDVLLHLPMEAQTSNHRLGPGALILGMTREQVIETLAADLASVPHAIGVSNHMGSLLTGEREPMQWVMAGLKQHGNLMFIDSRTTARTVAAGVASEEQVPALSRDVFLDNESGTDYIRSQFLRLVEKAKRNGYALGVCHPRPDTLQVLNQVLPYLDQYGVRLVRLSDLITIRQRSVPAWQLSSSPSPQAAKN